MNKVIGTVLLMVVVATFGVGLLALLVRNSSAPASKELEPEWQHKFDLDEMTDQERHGLNTSGVTKRGEEFYFSFVCLGPSKLVVFHENGSRSLGWGEEDQESGIRYGAIEYRVGKDAPVQSQWMRSMRDEDAVWYDGELSPQTNPYSIENRSLAYGRWEILVETQNSIEILKLMNALAAGQELLVELDGDVSRIAPSKYFVETYAQVKEGCGF